MDTFWQTETVSTNSARVAPPHIIEGRLERWGSEHDGGGPSMTVGSGWDGGVRPGRWGSGHDGGGGGVAMTENKLHVCNLD